MRSAAVAHPLRNESAVTLPNTDKRKKLLKFAIVSVAAIATIVVAIKTLPIADFLTAMIAWVESLGFWAPVAYIAIYIVSVVFLVPGSVLTAAAGTLFGITAGSIYVSVAATLGATLAFLVGRYLARGEVEKMIAGNERFTAIDSAVAGEGWKIVFLTRLSPVFPFALLNYAYGVTRVKLRDYFVASWIGMMPGTVLYVYIGSIGKAASEGRTPAQWVMYGLGLVATIIVTIYVTKIARRALRERIVTDSD